MSNSPLVSVMIITYNSAHFIVETLDSVLAQDYPNLEIIVSDDASTDETCQILQEYHLQYPNIVKPIFNKVNQGITKNSNVALWACKGEYISLMGGDDVMLPGKLSCQISAMKQDDNCVLSYHNVEVFNESLSTSVLYVTRQQKIIINYFDCLSEKVQICASSVMFRKSAVPKHGFDESIVVASDWLFLVEILIQGKGLYIDKTLCRYRRHANNVTNCISPFARQCNADHMLSAIILLVRYPEKESEILLAISFKCRKLRSILFSAHGYRSVLYSSLAFKFNFKAFLGIIVNYVTLGAVKF